MGLFGFQIRPVSGPEIVDFWGLNGPEPAQNPLEVVEREAPHHFKWVGDRFGAVYTTKIDDLRSGNRPDLKTKQSDFQTYLTLEGSRSGWPCTNCVRAFWLDPGFQR